MAIFDMAQGAVTGREPKRRLLARTTTTVFGAASLLLVLARRGEHQAVTLQVNATTDEDITEGISP
jgi:hypothetical protein